MTPKSGLRPYLQQDIARRLDDIANAYPKYMNVTFDEANDYVIRYMRDTLLVMPKGVKIVRFEFNQSVLKCIEQLHSQQYGIGKHVESIDVSEDFTTFKVKFFEPIDWDIYGY